LPTPVSLNLPSGRRVPTPLARARQGVVDCEACLRLRAYCRRVARERKRAHRDDVYWGRPVPGFGDPRARLLLVGLAPAAHGANRTGRVFTGDGSGDFLMGALHRAGFASIPTARDVADGLRLTDAYILSAARCAPPDNKPTPEELVRCRVHLDAEASALPRVEVVVALGRIAFDAWLQWMARQGARLRPRPPFAHAAVVKPDGRLPVLLGCYHPSRQNTNTGRLTPAMMDEVFSEARDRLRSPRPGPARPRRAGW
jgi:uracil-DNA glycosylase family 4